MNTAEKKAWEKEKQKRKQEFFLPAETRKQVLRIRVLEGIRGKGLLFIAPVNIFSSSLFVKSCIY